MKREERWGELIEDNGLIPEDEGSGEETAMDINIKRMGEERLTKRAWNIEERDRRRRGG